MKRADTITVRIAPKHKERLNEIANKYDCSMSDVVNTAISRYLKNETRRERIEKERQQVLEFDDSDTITDDS